MLLFGRLGMNIENILLHLNLLFIALVHIHCNEDYQYEKDKYPEGETL